MKGLFGITVAVVATFSFSFLSSFSADAGHGHAKALSAPAKYRYVVDLKGQKASSVRATARAFSSLGVDVAGVNYRKRTVEVIATEAEASVLRAKFGIRSQRQSGSPLDNLDERYSNPVEIAQKMKALADRFPQIAKLHEIGRSVEGRPILALELTSPDPIVKPNILFDGMHHAREIMTPEIVLDIAETLLQGVREGRRSRKGLFATDLLSRARVWVVPQLNPDGNNIIWTGDLWWRKNAYKDRGEIVGVDLNRNYSFDWSKCNGSSGVPTSDTYRGPSPASEPETQAIIKLADRIRPIGYITYHSFGELVLAPYGCEGVFTPEHELLKQIGAPLAESLQSDDGKGHYTFGTTWQVLYPTDGASKDYIYSQFGAPAFTIEVNEAFQPDYELREPTLKKHRAGWARFSNDLLQNLLTVRTKSAAGKPMGVRIQFAEVSHKRGERDFSTDEMGTFYKVLAKGNYTIRVIDQSGRGQEKTFQMSGQPLDLEFIF